VILSKLLSIQNKEKKLTLSMRVRVKLTQMSKWMFLHYIFICEILFSTTYP